MHLQLQLQLLLLLLLLLQLLSQGHQACSSGSVITQMQAPPLHPMALLFPPAPDVWHVLPPPPSTLCPPLPPPTHTHLGREAVGPRGGRTAGLQQGDVSEQARQLHGPARGGREVAQKDARPPGGERGWGERRR